MLNNTIFYHQLTKKIVIAFGTLFSNIKIKREDPEDKVSPQIINVPIAMAPKEKWLVRLEQEPNLDKRVYTTLPRMSFEILGLNYDPSRSVNKLQQIKCINKSTGDVSSVYSPVPYSFSIGMYILTKTSEDGFQIIEQIFPFFKPDYTMKVRLLDNPKYDVDIPITLNSASVMDEYDGMFDSRRFVTWSLNFTMKSYFFQQVNQYNPSNSSIILDSNVDLISLDDFTSINLLIDP